MQLLISNEQQEAAVGEDLCSLIENALKDVLALEEVSGCPSGGRARKCEVGIEEGIGGADANKNLASHLPPLTSQIEVSLALVDDVGMAALNQQYRGIADTTDVLSFPMIEYRSQESVVRSQECKEGIGEARLPRRAPANENPTTDMEVLLGDIVISVPRALDQAAAYGNSFKAEMVFLAVHGMLHLLGYDDETDGGAARMMEIARQVMDKLGLGAVRDA